MGSRTITVSDKVYLRLCSVKKNGESFSKLLGRLVKGPFLIDLASALPKERVDLLRRSVEEGRARSRGRRYQGVRGWSSTRRS